VVQVSQDSEIGALVSTTEYLPGRRVRTTNASIPTVVTYTGADAAKLDWPVRIELAEGAVLDIPRDVFGKPTSITRRASNGSGDVDPALCLRCGAAVVQDDRTGNRRHRN
jgi:hypothetical protein